MVEYINGLPKLSVEVKQLDQHKDELEVCCMLWVVVEILCQMKSKEADGKEYEVDDIKTCSNFFELCLQVSSDNLSVIEYCLYRLVGIQ